MDWLLEIKTPKHLVLAVADRAGKVEGAEALVASLSPHLRWVEGYQKEEGWPGLYLASLFARAGRKEEITRFVDSHQPMAPLHWKHFGEFTEAPHLGDVGIFRHNPIGYVGLYVGETEDRYALLGGVQKHRVGLNFILKESFLHWRRPRYKLVNPALGKVYLGPDGCPAP